MDPFLEVNPIFQELHTQMLAEAQAHLQPQLRPKYVARLERHLSEGSVWGLEPGVISLERKEPDITVAALAGAQTVHGSTAVLATPTASATEELDGDELELRKQRRIVIYVQARPRLAVTSIELLSPSNKASGSLGQARYLEKRSSALHGGLHWVEIDLLRAGERPSVPVSLANDFDYLAYIAQAIPSGWNHLAFTWGLREPIPALAIPLLGSDQASLDLGFCFKQAYDRIAADEEVDYTGTPPPPPLRDDDRAWMDEILRQRGLRG
jgi:hypothetical protein